MLVVIEFRYTVYNILFSNNIKIKYVLHLMATFTREYLHNKQLQSFFKKNEDSIQYYFTYIKDAIIKSNNNGDTIYIYPFLFCNEDCVIEIIRRLQEIFVDTEFLYCKKDNKITCDWTFSSNLSEVTPNPNPLIHELVSELGDFYPPSILKNHPTENKNETT